MNEKKNKTTHNTRGVVIPRLSAKRPFSSTWWRRRGGSGRPENVRCLIPIFLYTAYNTRPIDRIFSASRVGAHTRRAVEPSCIGGNRGLARGGLVPPKVYSIGLSPPKDISELSVEKDLTIMINDQDIVDGFSNKNVHIIISK